jgi:hypothetical protein
MNDQNLIELLERRDAAWAWLMAYPRSHRETARAERHTYNEYSKAFCAAEDAVLTELRQRGKPFVFGSRRFSAEPAGLAIDMLGPNGQVVPPGPARGGAA